MKCGTRKTYFEDIPEMKLPKDMLQLAEHTTLYELLELNGPYTLSEMHLKMLQQDYQDGLLARKIAKVVGRR